MQTQSTSKREVVGSTIFLILFVASSINLDMSRSFFSHVELFEHQVRPAQILLKQRSLLLYHTPGSGKTYAALYAVNVQNQQVTNSIYPQVIILAPAKVISEVWRPIVYKTRLPNLFTMMSYELARSRLGTILSSIDRSKKVGDKYILICDEIHNARNIRTKVFRTVFSIAAQCHKVILLTGTPIVNSVEDALALARLLHNDSRIFFRTGTFINNHTLQVTDLPKFKKIFEGFVDSYPPPRQHVESSKEGREGECVAGYPELITIDKIVDMYPLQQKRYEEFVTELMTPALRQLLEEGIISSALNPFLVRTRAISNTVGKFKLPGEKDEYEQSEKFIGIRESLLSDPGPAVVYSFFLSNGVVPLKEYIDSTTSLKTELISGETKAKDVSMILGDYNRGKFDVLFITSSLDKGITLLNTRVLHLMEPTWNEATEEQIVRRVARYGSHFALPPEERNVRVYSWITRMPRERRIFSSVSTDEYVHGLAERKQRINKLFEHALQQ